MSALPTDVAEAARLTDNEAEGKMVVLRAYRCVLLVTSRDFSKNQKNNTNLYV